MSKSTNQQKGGKANAPKTEAPKDEAPVEETTPATESTEEETPTESTEEAPVEETPTESEEEPEEVEEPVVPKATVSSNLPNAGGVRASTTVDPRYVDQLTVPTKNFVSVVGKAHNVKDFNDAKVNMYAALAAAVRYPDSDNFIASLNAFLEIFKENRDGAFHEMNVNAHTAYINLSGERARELNRLLSVFHTLASDDAKDIGALVDFSAVFTKTTNNDVVNRFRNWAVRAK